MDMMERDRFRDKLTGQPFIVKKIKGGLLFWRQKIRPISFLLAVPL